MKPADSKGLCALILTYIHGEIEITTGPYEQIDSIRHQTIK